MVPASSTLIYGAIWCQVIAHQYPIYHPACHGLWRLFHKAKASEKGPVTQSTGRGCRKCSTFEFFSPHLFLAAQPSLEWGRLGVAGEARGRTVAAPRAGSSGVVGRLLKAQGCLLLGGAPLSPPFSPISFLNKCALCVCVCGGGRGAD